ncbi:hypothetical protein PF005_g9396 [Phytophthora fragariae]|uniref:Uncharacterized protein n=1 Tax=Phytophthora fragariae TaxID=53985 RepID=A0A6A3YBF4_9STRA|nr:hypothetical protein PF009_g10438 [Phytophthora fragariae]KAE8965826.1 hypothetical protein PF011_g28148 [Phytophthora fragariae]KAE9117075.1 hypothetical protein PF010_g8738 [Phytophthora fragariae]KAE9215568.1 hypothetical protein PF005_g9396 [Phytophthora fragariae]KAE9238252.1 hypothetical protein PF004_g8363 [Phytophthora fragariae]
MADAVFCEVDDQARVGEASTADILLQGQLDTVKEASVLERKKAEKMKENVNH